MEYIPLTFPTKEPDVIYRDGKRYYGVDGIYVPSVTTVLGSTSDKSSLEEWKKRVGEEEAARISKEATDNGTLVHKLCEDFLEFGKLEKSGSNKADIMFGNIKVVLKKNLTEWYGQEIALHSKNFLIAGRTDLLGFWKGKMSIIDYKTNNKQLPKLDDHILDYKLQCAAYSLILKEIGYDFSQGVLLITSLYGCQEIIFDLTEYKRPFLERRAAFEKIYKTV